MGADSLINLHTHTTYSDGDFRPEEIVGRAAMDGLAQIAITDHFDTLKVRSLGSAQLPDYLHLIESLGNKYGNGVGVKAGVEIDTNPSRCELFSLPFAQLNELDLVLFEGVADPWNGGIDLGRFEDLRSRFNVPCGLAHPDVSRVFSHLPPGELADLLEDLDVFVEVNTAHPYVREGRYFFELSTDYYREFRGRVGISVGTDVHHTLSEVSNLGKAYAFVRKIGLEGDLIF